MEQPIQLQFLDLDDVDSNEQDYVKSILYSSARSPRLKLPWVEPEEAPQQWNQEHYETICTAPTCYQLTYLQDGEAEIPGLEPGSIPPANEYYPVQPPAQTTMPQLIQVMPPMPPSLPPTYVSNMGHPPPHNLGYYIYQQEERGRRPRSKPSPKRPERREPTAFPPPPAPPPVQYSPTYPMHVHVPPAAYQYLPQPPSHIPSAQHATGPPLYLAPHPQMYPAHIFPAYTQVFSPLMPHEDYNKEQQQPHDEKQMNQDQSEKPVDKPPSLPINAIKTTAPPVVTAVVKKQQPSVRGNVAPSTPTNTGSPPNGPPPPELSPPAASPVPPPSQEPGSPPPPASPVPAPAPPAPAPVILPPGPTPVQPPQEKPDGGKSWAGLFKRESSSDPPPQRKPPMFAVVNRPPPDTKPAPPPQVKAPPQPHVDPLLRDLGECLSTYQLEHKALALTPRGLNNPSNYCYINATLQALLACPAFYNLIKMISQVKDAAGSGPPPGQAPPQTKTPIIDSMVQFIKEFSPAPVNRSGRKEKANWKDKEDLDVPVGISFEPTYVYKMLHVLRNENAFQVEGRQEDAEEFLSLLLNGLNDEMLELVKLVEDPNKPAPLVNGDFTANGESHIEDTSDWKEVSKGMKGGRITRRAEMGKTPLSEIFRGQLRSRVQRAAEESTDSVQPFFTLQLDIESSESVNEALEKYFGAWDRVEGDSSDGDSMQLRNSIEELPNVLILHLKCFLYRQQSCHKISKPLEFPIDLKIDTKFLSNKTKSSTRMRTYKLFAVVYHEGKEASKGHYLADVYHVGSGGWVRYDDALVRPVTEAVLLKPKPPRMPYLLYYRRADTIGHHSQTPR